MRRFGNAALVFCLGLVLYLIAANSGAGWLYVRRPRRSTPGGLRRRSASPASKVTLQRLGLLPGDVHPELGHRRRSLRPVERGLRAGAHDLEAVPGEVPQEPPGHLGARRVGVHKNRTLVFAVVLLILAPTYLTPFLTCPNRLPPPPEKPPQMATVGTIYLKILIYQGEVAPNRAHDRLYKPEA
jgi:hypothetical protein